MSRPIFFTVLKHIKRTEVVVRLLETPNQRTRFTAELALDRHRLPHQAQIIVEAYDDAYLERIPGGTVGQPALSEPQTLNELQPGHRPKFRVKVVEPASGGAGRLLASINAVRALTSDGKDGGTSLLELVKRTREELGHELWRVHIPESSEPEPALWVNDDVPGLFDRFQQNQPEIMALIMPEVLRRVLTELFVDPELEEVDRADEGPRGRWLAFAEAISLSTIDDDDGDAEGTTLELTDILRHRRRWVNDVVKAFAQSHRFVDIATAEEGEMEGFANG